MMYLTPLTLKQANEVVTMFHRHHKPVRGHRFSLGARDRFGLLRGAAIVGRPVAREVPQFSVCEVTRLVTDGHKNMCSFLYGACARVAREMGYEKIQTYILDDETGITLSASGWTFESYTDGGDWNCEARGGRRVDQPQGRKQRWSKRLNSPLRFLRSAAA